MSHDIENSQSWITIISNTIKKIPKLLKGQNKKVKSILYVTVILWIAVLSQLFVNHFFTDDSKLVDAFTKTNSAVMDSNLYLVADLGTN